MRLILSPIRGLPGQPETRLIVRGDTLIVNEVEYDLSPVPEGGLAVPEGRDHPFDGPIRRESGGIHATVRVLLGDDAGSIQPTDPEHWTISTAEGEIDLPVVRRLLEDVRDTGGGA